MVNVRQSSVTLNDEAFRAAEEMSLIEQMDVDGFVSTLVVGRSRYPRALSDESEIGEISSLLSSILTDAQAFAPQAPKFRRATRISSHRRRRLLAR